MIKLNLNNVISNKEMNSYSKKVNKLAVAMENKESVGSDFLGWKDFVNNYNKPELYKVKKIAEKLHNSNVDVMFVIGIGGSFSGAWAGIDMVQGNYSNKNKVEIIYVGNSISSTDLYQKLEYVKNKKFAINIISKSGTTTEPAIAFRIFKDALEKKVGKKEASNLIIATTDKNKGALLSLAKKNSYERFVVPDNIGGRFSVITPVGAFPMAVAGLNIDKFFDGLKDGYEKYKSTNLDSNDAYQYAVSRVILNKKYPVELMVQYEPQMNAFNEWWKQLAGESEGKDGKGIMPASAVFSTDLHSLGQFIQDGSKIMFETVLTVKKPNFDIKIPMDDSNLDGLNYLVGKTVQDVNNVAFSSTLEAHSLVGKVPNIHIEFDKMDEKSFGELVVFFSRAVAMTAYLQDSNPFNQPGVEIYKNMMFKKLKKPGY
ncbi:MAG: glucose-6-phosphate isomerase [Mollicutes bacterium PWAP]|nr:glucose-6-phosphate isomerase [Mollicutes bacterium PWAP]